MVQGAGRVIGKKNQDDNCKSANETLFHFYLHCAFRKGQNLSHLDFIQLPYNPPSP